MAKRPLKDHHEENQAIVENFVAINERQVDDINLDIFYKPHTITLLAVSIAAVIVSAFIR